MSSFLDNMIASRMSRIGADFGELSPADLERLACGGRRVRDFANALSKRDIAIIAEVKKASPSAGPIAPECEASKQALHYQRGGASAISVLTRPRRATSNTALRSAFNASARAWSVARVSCSGSSTSESKFSR